MKSNKYILFFLILFLGILANAQEDKRDDYLKEADTILQKPIQLEEVLVSKNQQKLDAEALKQFAILQRRVYKVYPFAKTGAERLVALNVGMSKLTTNREKSKYFKIVEQYMNNEFEQQLKNLSRKDGQILVKLIHRQTGKSAYELIRDLKSGWKAFWSNNTASLFDIDLKRKYDPIEVNEDYLIETILKRAFIGGRLTTQPSAFPIDYDEVAQLWREKLNKKE